MGKSTLVSMIQFGLNKKSITGTGQKEYEEMIHNLLGEGNSVMILFYGVDNRLYFLKRTYISGKDNQSSFLYRVEESNELIPIDIEKLVSLLRVWLS